MELRYRESGNLVIYTINYNDIVIATSDIKTYAYSDIVCGMSIGYSGKELHIWCGDYTPITIKIKDKLIINLLDELDRMVRNIICSESGEMHLNGEIADRVMELHQLMNHKLHRILDAVPVDELATSANRIKDAFTSKTTTKSARK